MSDARSAKPYAGAAEPPEIAPERLEVDHRSQTLERIARRRQRPMAPVQIEEPGLTRLPPRYNIWP